MFKVWSLVNGKQTGGEFGGEAGVYMYPVMCCFMTGRCSEKCVVRQLHPSVSTAECTYTDPDATADYTPKLCGVLSRTF